MRLTFCGDVSIAAAIRSRWETISAGELLGGAAPLFRASDQVFVNLECALTDQAAPIQKLGPNLSAPPRLAQLLRESGVTACGLSNNHILDFGLPGLADTLRALEDAGLSYTGIGENARDARRDWVFCEGGRTVRVLAVCEHEYSYALENVPGARAYDPYDTMADIRRAKEQADYVAVLYHGGKEHCPYPSPRLRRLCQAMAENGADLVLCQHSHCIGCYEEFQGATLLYGQGNFCFPYGDSSADWRQALAVQVELGDRPTVRFIPVETRDAGTFLAEDGAAREILDRLESRSRDLLTDAWLDGWHRFCEENRSRYTDAIEKNTQLFAHYLDCEAHTDVWRELFPTWRRSEASAE